MNKLFIAIGSLIVVALFAVLIVPLFIDWSSHRTTFEREATRLLGHPVRVKGTADAQILPIPTFTFTHIEVGSNPSAPIMSAARLRVRVELLPLLQRQIDVIDMQLDNPQASLRLAEDGTSNWATAPNEGALADKVSVKLGPVTIHNGVIYFANRKNDVSFRMQEIDALVTAQSLLGPWKVEGTGVHEEENVSFQVSTGKYENGNLRTKLALEPEQLLLDAVLDGTLQFQDETGSPAPPSFAGKVRLGAVELVEETEGPRRRALRSEGWQLDGGIELDADKLLITNAVFEDGAREAPLNLNGALSIPFSKETRFDAVISSRQIDLDRAYGGGPNEPLDLNRAREVLASLISRLPKPPIPGQIGVDIPGLVIAGDVIRSIHFDATPTEDGWKLEDFGAVLPGTTQMRFDGDIQTQAEFELEGNVNVSSERPIAFARWWRPDNAQALRRSRIDSYSVSGRLVANARNIDLSDLRADIDGSDLSGKISIQRPSVSFSQLNADLKARQLNFDAVQALAALFVGEENLSGVGRNDTISLKLSANSFIAQSLNGKDANLDIRISNGELDIRNFKIADFAGATIDASGLVKNILSEPTGGVRATVEAQSLTGLTKIGDVFLPGHPALHHLRENGSAMVPLDLAMTFSGVQTTGGDGQRSNDLTFGAIGRLGSSEIETNLHFVGALPDWLEGDLAVSLKSTHEKTSDLLGKIGWPYVDIGQTGAAETELTISGKPGQGLVTKLKAKLGEVSASSDLTVTLSQDFKPSYEGAIGFSGRDVEPLMQLLGYPLPAMGLGTAMEFVGKIKGNGYSGTIDNITALASENLIKGKLSYELNEKDRDGRWHWTGELQTDRFALPWMLAVATGETIVPKDLSVELIEEGLQETTGAQGEDGAPYWPERVFGDPYIANVKSDLSIRAKSFEISPGQLVEDVVFELSHSENSLQVTDFKGKYKGGNLSGRLSAENASGSVSLSGSLELANAPAEALLWTDGQRPLVEGALTLNSQFEGVGRSYAAIIGSLDGGGSITLSNGRLRRLNPSAFSRLVDAADQEIDLDLETVTPLVFSHLDSGALNVVKMEAPFNITGGNIRITNTILKTESDLEDLDTVFTGALNLTTLNVNGSMALNVDSASLDESPVSGAVPEIALLFEGPLERPKRTIDIQPLLGYLTVRRFEQEVRQVERLQADILEKQRLSRYARWISAEAEREKREAEEAEKRRLEELRLKQEEQLRRQEEERIRQEQAALQQRKLEEEERARQEAAVRDRLEREALARAIAAEEQRLNTEGAEVTQDAPALLEAPIPLTAPTTPGVVSAPTERPVDIERHLRNLEERGLRYDGNAVNRRPRDLNSNNLVR